jgi:hypothetical protein
MPLTVLFCADPLDPRRADPHFAREAASVRAIYGEAPLIDHDALQRGDLAEAVRRVPRDLGPAWYRGWMVTGGQYEQLAAALDDKGTPLICPPTTGERTSCPAGTTRSPVSPRRVSGCRSPPATTRTTRSSRPWSGTFPTERPS